MAMGERRQVIPDASVVVKWYVPERHHAAARSLRDAYLHGDLHLLAPALLPFEVVNALRYSGLFDDEQVGAAAETLPQYGIELVPFSALGPVADVATAADVSIYDAAYLALAASMECTLYSADERLVEAADSAPGDPAVEHVRAAGTVE